jgi:RimJ/RimL family protein N-acetyltransferase
MDISDKPIREMLISRIQQIIFAGKGIDVKRSEIDKMIDKTLSYMCGKNQKELSELTLERATKDDSELLVRIVSNIRKYNGLSKSIREVLDVFTDDNTRTTIYNYGLFKIQYDGETAGLFRADKTRNPKFKNSDRMVELSYIVDPTFRGLGIAPAAMNLYIKKIKKINDIPYVSIDVGNIASTASLTRYNNKYAAKEDKLEYKFSTGESDYEVKYYSTSDASVRDEPEKTRKRAVDDDGDAAINFLKMVMEADYADT